MPENKRRRLPKNTVDTSDARLTLRVSVERPHEQARIAWFPFGFARATIEKWKRR